MSGDSIAISKGPDLFLRRSLDPNVLRLKMQGFGEDIFHGCYEGGDFRFLSDQCGVDIDDLQTEFSSLFARLLEDFLGGDSLDCVIRVWEIVTNVRQPACPENRVGNGMAQDICVGMAQQAAGVIDLYAASILAATGRATIPQADWERVRVYLPNSQRRQVIREQAFERTDAVRAYRIYREEALQVKKRKRKRVSRGERRPLALPIAANQRWSLDFQNDMLANGRMRISSRNSTQLVV